MLDLNFMLLNFKELNKLTDYNIIDSLYENMDQLRTNYINNTS